MLFPSPHTMHMHYITPMLYIFQIVGRCHTARPPSPQKSQRLWLTENGFPEKTLVWLICERYICSVWDKFSSRQAVLTFWLLH